MEPIVIASSIAKKLETAWNNGSGKEFQESFTSPTDFVNIMGAHFFSVTRDEIGAGHQAIFDTIYKGSTIKYEIVQASMIDTNTILAHMKSSLTSPSGPMAGVNGSIMTLVLIQENNEWKVRAFQNTLIRERMS